MAIRKILRLPAVKEASGYDSTSQIYALMAKGEFPRPVKIGEQAVGWYEDEIEAWQQQRPRATGGWCPRDGRRRKPVEATA